MQSYLQSTAILDFEHPSIQTLIDQQGWQTLSAYDAIGAVYNFVRDDILFGYNSSDELSASMILKDGYGQCNTKGSLLMALFRALGIPSRFHGFTIDNALQRGAIPDYLMTFAPDSIIHSWVEVYYDNQWLELEGFIIDSQFLGQIQRTFADSCQAFSGYGIATPCLKKPENQWQGSHTYIQKEGINQDLGVYDDPDSFYRHQGSNLSGPKKWLYRYLLRHLLNFNVNKIRRQGLTRRAPRSVTD